MSFSWSISCSFSWLQDPWHLPLLSEQWPQRFLLSMRSLNSYSCWIPKFSFPDSHIVMTIYSNQSHFSVPRLMYLMVDIINRLSPKVQLNTILVHGFCLHFNILKGNPSTPIFRKTFQLSTVNISVLWWIDINWLQNTFWKYLQMYKKCPTRIEDLRHDSATRRRVRSDNCSTRPTSFSYVS